MSIKKNILICDVNIKKEGHYIGYNQYILDNFIEIEKNQNQLYFTFLYNSEAKQLLHISSEVSERVHYIEVEHGKGFLKSNVLIFNKIKKHISDYGISSMVFLDLDKYQLGLAVTKFDCTISGILFRPHHRINSSNTSLAARTNTFIKRWKKIVSEKLLLSNEKVNKVFILNDNEGVKVLNQKHRTNAFKYLTDPIFCYNVPRDRSTFNINSTNNIHTFLIFGAINERKNITNIIKAYALTNLKVRSKLLIVGPGKQEYIQELNNLVESLQILKDGHKTIEIKNEFVSNEEMDNYFSMSDTCLLIYKNFFGSSGLLGRAALHNLKVIGPNVGLLKEIISENELGITCDPENVDEISTSLNKSVDLQIPQSTFQQFYEQYSPEQFIKTLLTSN